MRYEAKSIIIGRKPRIDKDDYSNRPCFISFFDVNNPHKLNIAPNEIVEFLKINRVIIKGMDINFLLMGGDLLVNDLEYVEIEESEGHVLITGKQNK